MFVKGNKKVVITCSSCRVITIIVQVPLHKKKCAKIYSYVTILCVPAKEKAIQKQTIILY